MIVIMNVSVAFMFQGIFCICSIASITQKASCQQQKVLKERCVATSGLSSVALMSTQEELNYHLRAKNNWAKREAFWFSFMLLPMYKTLKPPTPSSFLHWCFLLKLPPTLSYNSWLLLVAAFQGFRQWIHPQMLFWGDRIWTWYLCLPCGWSSTGGWRRGTFLWLILTHYPLTQKESFTFSM